MYACSDIRLRWLTISDDLMKHKTGSIETFRLNDAILEGLRDMSITKFFPIQAEVIPVLLKAHGLFDVLVNAPTGSGKTLTYAIPILQVSSITSFIR
jgi:ATP-dependent RNA helicase DDX51/DBP6